MECSRGSTKKWNNFKDTFRDAQKAMRKTGERSTPDNLNHTDLLNVVSEGVKQAITEVAPPTKNNEMIEEANAVRENNENILNEQIEAMSAKMEQMQHMLFAAPQANQPLHQYQQPFGWNPILSQYPNQYPNQNPFGMGPNTTDVHSNATTDTTSIVGHTVAVDMSDQPASIKKKATKTRPHFVTRWAAPPSIAGTDSVGWFYKIVLVIILNMHVI